MKNSDTSQKIYKFNPEHQSVLVGIKHAALSPPVHAALFLG